MKLRTVTKRDKRNKMTLKGFDDDVMSGNCDIIIIFPIYVQFGAIRELDSRCIVWKKLTFSLTVIFYLTKSGNRTKKSLTEFSHYCFE